MDFEFVNNATLSPAIYLMLAYHVKGNEAESIKYLGFIKTNADRLEPDERIRLKRNLDKLRYIGPGLAVENFPLRFNRKLKKKTTSHQPVICETACRLQSLSNPH